ncbi:tryptophan synthase beta subunit-like PLP-dependent enzyme [Phanerochaete sordida]|uniref:L-serine ammonia-lyase n=1 Tax=Phanerochaete sordida TaxID=48140 RepID=A0A9P3G2D0_9APHY|nr:tryptophan synthase beta subunit-like PLP-dependent enzyme [Phanerochaete sordida]
MDTPLYLETPLVHSKHISHALGADVYLKLDFLQPSQSYKFRGVSHLVQRARAARGPRVHLVAASGGNAGLATACAGAALGLRTTIVVPCGAAPSTLAFFAMQRAHVVQRGTIYQHALDAARELVAADPDAVLVQAYDDPVLWDGHASMMKECARQLPAAAQARPPDAVVCCVGGGGLAGGVMVGCERVGWGAVPLVAMETHGSNCFYASLALSARSGFAGAPRPPPAGASVLHDADHGVDVAQLPELRSRATSLGASWPSPGIVRMALDREGPVVSATVSDEMAMGVAWRFADEHKVMVELACATTLAPAYNKELFDKLVPPRADGARRTVIFIVCGGFKTSVADLIEFKQISAADPAPAWDVWCNGEKWSVPKQ